MDHVTSAHRPTLMKFHLLYSSNAESSNQLEMGTKTPALHIVTPLITSPAWSFTRQRSEVDEVQGPVFSGESQRQKMEGK